MTVDWRGEICRFLATPSNAGDDEILDALDLASDLLREAERLKSRAQAHQGPPRFQVIHRIYCKHSQAERGLYFDPPWVVKSGPNLAHLRGSHAINNLELHLERNKEITFIVYREFECCGRPPPRREPSRASTIDPSAFLTREYITLVSEDLGLALSKLADLAFQGIPHPDFDEDVPRIQHPYLWWFSRRKEIEAVKLHLSESVCRHVEVFQNYLQEHLGSEWETVDALLSRGYVTAEYL